MIRILFLLSGLFSLGQCAIGQLTYSADEYKISYPENWKMDESGAMGTDFMAFSEQEGPADNFRENVNIVREDVSAYNIDLENYVKSSEQMIISMITDAKIISVTKRENYYELDFLGKQGIYNLRFKQRAFIKSNYAYIITFTAKEEDYEKYLPIATDILDSFEL